MGAKRRKLSEPERVVEIARFALRGHMLGLGMHGNSDDRIARAIEAERTFEQAIRRAEASR